VEDVGEQGEERLRAIELEEGADSTESYSRDCLVVGTWVIGLSGRFQDSGYKEAGASVSEMGVAPAAIKFHEQRKSD
jgi:hypothetical protein